MDFNNIIFKFALSISSKFILYFKCLEVVARQAVSLSQLLLKLNTIWNSMKTGGECLSSKMC